MTLPPRSEWIQKLGQQTNQAMEYPKTNTIVRHSDAEVCLNLWYFQNAGIVMPLAGKAYALVGSEQQKLSVLRSLTGADYLTATRGFVPQKFQMTMASDTLAGAVPANMIHDYHSAVFGPLIDKIEAELPKQMHVVQGK